jgi:hypothetical protein
MNQPFSPYFHKKTWSSSIGMVITTGGGTKQREISMQMPWGISVIFSR